MIQIRIVSQFRDHDPSIVDQQFHESFNLRLRVDGMSWIPRGVVADGFVIINCMIHNDMLLSVMIILSYGIRSYIVVWK